jgi:hypothetical protein
MYSDVITNPFVFPVIPTTALMYTAGKACIIPIIDPMKRYLEKGEPLAQGFSKDFKGNPGVRDERTLRGGVIFRKALENGANDLEGENIDTIDPLKMFRFLVSQNSPIHSKVPKEFALMNYTGLGVHVPDGNQMLRDLNVLLTDGELEKILMQLREYNID